MKTFLSVIGILTLAQWLFITMLHVFISVQDKRSPETLAKLHDLPIVGGYFPDAVVPTEDDTKQVKADMQLKRILEAKKFYDLPDAFDAEELNTLIAEVRSQKVELADSRSKLEERRLEVLQLVDDFERRETALLDRQKLMDAKAKDMKKREDELVAKLNAANEDTDIIEMQNLKKVAAWMDGMDPVKAAGFIVPDAIKAENATAQRKRYQDAAKLLSLMNPESASLVIANIEPMDWLEIEKEKRKLPLKKKKK